MRITTAAWTEYIRRMTAVSEEAAGKMQKWIQRNGFGNDEALIEYAFALSSHYGEAIGALACEMYEKIADAQGVTIEPAEIADTPEYGEVAKAVHGTMNESLNKVGPTVGRLVKQTGADTMLKNAIRDGVNYAWVAFGDTCPYCLMISAIGWRRAGKNTLRGKHADHIHPHCDCQYVVDFKGDLKVEGYDPQKMREQIMDIVDPDGLEYGDFEGFLNYHGKYSLGLQKRDKRGLRILRRGLAEKKKEITLSRARNIKSIDELRNISKSAIIEMETIEEITKYFSDKGIEVKGFDKQELFAVKTVMAGVDDVITTLEGTEKYIKSIEYNPKIKAMGQMKSSGLMEIGKKGMQDYGTGAHEAAHAFDFGKTKDGNPYSEKIVETARKNLKLRKNSKAYVNLAVQITGDLQDAKDSMELFAYGIETALGGVDNKLAAEILRVAKEG